MLAKALVHVVGGIGSRGLIFLVNMLVATTYLVGEAAYYALVIGWANAIASIVVSSVGSLYRKRFLQAAECNASEAIISVVFLAIVIAVPLWLSSVLGVSYGFPVFSLLPVVLGLTLVGISAFIASVEGRVVWFNVCLISGSLLYFVIFMTFELDVSTLLFIYSLVNALVSIVFFGARPVNVGKAIKMLWFHRSYLISLSIQSLLGLPVLMFLQSYIVAMDNGEEIIVRIFLYVQIFNVINIVAQKVNQTLVPALANHQHTWRRFLVKYNILAFGLLVGLNVIVVLVNGNLYVVNIHDFYYQFFVFSIFYLANTTSWVYLDLLNVVGLEKLVERTSYVWTFSVVSIFLVLSRFAFDMVVIYGLSIGAARIVQLVVINIMRPRY